MGGYGTIRSRKLQKDQCLSSFESDTTNMKLFSLPAELLVGIVALLDIPDILTFCRVCRLANELVVNSATLQYIIALFATGMADEGRRSPLTTRDRLSYLSQREELWSSLDLKTERRVVIPVQHRHSHIHDLNGGVYIFGELSLVPDTIRVNSLRFAHLPSCAHDMEKFRAQASSWTNFPLGIEALNIGVSLQHNDLLAVLTSVPLP